MLIRQTVLNAIKRGEIDLQFRRWTRRQVKTGGTLTTRVGVLRIGSVDVVEPTSVTDNEIVRSGFADRAEFDAWYDKMEAGELYRIDLGWDGEDPRIALRRKSKLDAGELAEIDATLDRFDARGGIGPWTTAFLDKIEKNPARLAEELGRELGLDKRPFKARVRKLKALGLTESLEVGYRLSPRGKAVLKHRRKLGRKLGR